MNTKMYGQVNSSPNFHLLTFLLFLIGFCPLATKPQSGYAISGNLIGKTNAEPVAFANVALLDTTQFYILSGAASNEAGKFSMGDVTPGIYLIRISAIGYENVIQRLELNTNHLNLGSVLMSEITFELDDVKVIASRIKAKQAIDNTTYFVNQKMKETSGIGIDILKLLPGVGVDFQNNITLEGSQNIIILVDGMERDRGYLKQLPASKIDKVEIFSSPPAKYDASVTGVINVILNKDLSSGMDGQIHLEIPSSGSEVFVNPAYNLNFGVGKFNLYTSYNGDIRKLKVTESYKRSLYINPDPSEIKSVQSLTQKTWSHRFHYGIDWFPDKQNQFNFYGYYNPFSQEMDGVTEVKASGGQLTEWKSLKNDDDINNSTFISFWYKHLLNKSSGHEFTLESSWYALNAENKTTYTETDTEIITQNKMEPDNRILLIKFDYSLPVSKSVQFNSGLHTRFRKLLDKNLSTFQYSDNIYAGYGTLSFNSLKIESMIGMRLEYTSRNNSNTGNNRLWLLLPDASLRYKWGGTRSLGLFYHRTVTYPGYYQLNDQTSVEDPFSISSGNPDLKPELISQVYIEVSRSFKDNYISARLFCQHVTDAIRGLMVLDDKNLFSFQNHNLGDIYMSGIQMKGTLGLGNAGINPYIRVYDSYSIPTAFAKSHHVKNKHQLVLESGVSAYVLFGKSYTASLTFQYNSPANKIQENAFSDALYFISIGKTFVKGIKAGIVSGIPFARNFTFEGSDINNKIFSHHSTGKLNMSAIPFWFTLNYQFSSGQKRQNIEREKSSPAPEIRKGF